MLWKRPPASHRRWFLLALVVWTLGQTVMFAYGRAYKVICPRYIDSFAAGILVNFACLISIAQSQLGKRHGWTIAGVSAWVILVLYSSVLYAGRNLPAELTQKRDTGLAQETNLRNYLATGDLHHLQDKPYLNVPHSNPERLASILAFPEIRAILPANIRAPLDPASADALASKAQFGVVGRQGPFRVGQRPVGCVGPPSTCPLPFVPGGGLRGWRRVGGGRDLKS